MAGLEPHFIKRVQRDEGGSVTSAHPLSSGRRPGWAAFYGVYGQYLVFLHLHPQPFSLFLRAGLALGSSTALKSCVTLSTLLDLSVSAYSSESQG